MLESVAKSRDFLDLKNQDYKNSRFVIVPIPYDATVSYVAGTGKGPRAIINSSGYLELYDEELKKDLSRQGIFTLRELKFPKKSPREVITEIAKTIKKILADKKFPLALGGEHSITLGAAEAFVQKYGLKNLSVLQLDAHADLRNEYEGTKFSHACVMRRIVDDLGLTVAQVGIRSLSEEEAEFLKKSKKNFVFYGRDFSAEKIIGVLKENVYLTLDLDVFDPSAMPAVGTPEPDGLIWREILNLLKKVSSRRKIVGADVVELCPIPGMVAPDFTAAKLVYKIIGLSAFSIPRVKKNLKK